MRGVDDLSCTPQIGVLNDHAPKRKEASGKMSKKGKWRKRPQERLPHIEGDFDILG